MFVFYGLDNFLLNQTVDIYIKVNFLNSELIKDKKNKELIVTYYLEPEYFELTIEKILNEASNVDLFNSKKIIIINDYYLVLNNNFKILEQFINKLEKFANKNIIILKILTNKLPKKIMNSNFETIFIDSYNKEQLKSWIINKNNEYKIQFAPKALDVFVSAFPNSLSIIDNELKQMKNLNQVIDIEIIRNFSNKYFSYNPYKLINFWLNKDYLTFWFQYRSYYENNNYDKANLFLIASYQLELIRNIKLLLIDGFSELAIVKKLKISNIQLRSLLKCQLEVKEINELLLKAHQLDFQVKTGKIAKNLAIDLFFCKI